MVSIPVTGVVTRVGEIRKLHRSRSFSYGGHQYKHFEWCLTSVRMNGASGHLQEDLNKILQNFIHTLHYVNRTIGKNYHLLNTTFLLS